MFIFYHYRQIEQPPKRCDFTHLSGNVQIENIVYNCIDGLRNKPFVVSFNCFLPVNLYGTFTTVFLDIFILLYDFSAALTLNIFFSAVPHILIAQISKIGYKYFGWTVIVNNFYIYIYIVNDTAVTNIPQRP